MKRRWAKYWRNALWVVMSCTGAAAQQASRDVSFEADSVSLDLQGGNSVFKGLTVSDGTLMIYAKEGTTTRSERGDGVWEFRGGLRLTVDTATLTANRGTLRFADGRFVQAELLGDPAT